MEEGGERMCEERVQDAIEELAEKRAGTQAGTKGVLLGELQSVGPYRRIPGDLCACCVVEANADGEAVECLCSPASPLLLKRERGKKNSGTL